MNKNKIAIFTILIASSLMLQSKVFALVADVNNSVNVGVKSGGMSSDINSKSEVSATTSDKMDRNNEDTNSDSEIKENNKDNSVDSDSDTKIENEHRSFVALFVHNLRSIADREGSIGEEVRVIAQEQNDSSSTTVNAIAKVENKGGFSRFLFGADYKNIGMIRSELVKIQNRIDKLSVLASSTTITLADKQELDLQITALKSEQAKLKTFVDVNENKFSLLGWFVKLFNK